MNISKPMLVVALALGTTAGCKRDNAPAAAPPAPAATTPAAAAPPSGANANANTNAGANADAGAVAAQPAARAPRGPCVVTLAQSFHLRPTATAASTGQELPANTEAEVLEPVPTVRRRGAVLMHLRVRAGGAEGYSFVTPAEMGANCPVLWPQAAAAGATGTASADAGGPPAVFPTRAAAVASLARGEIDAVPAGTRENVLARLDLDGDGTEDEFVKFELGSDRVSAVYVALFHPAAGFAATKIGIDFDEEHASFAEGSDVATELVRATGGPFFVLNGSQTSSDDGAVNDLQSYDLVRCRAGAACETVFSTDALFATAEQLTFTAAPDGAVAVRNDRGRTQTLRWNAATSRLVLE